jgi:hypothetical protein
MMTDVTKAADSIWAVAHTAVSSAHVFKNISSAGDLAAVQALYPRDWLVSSLHSWPVVEQAARVVKRTKRCGRAAAAAGGQHALRSQQSRGLLLYACLTAVLGPHLACRPSMTRCMQRATWWFWT